MNMFTQFLETYRITPNCLENVCLACPVCETVVAVGKKSTLFPTLEFAFSLSPVSSRRLQLRSIVLRCKALEAV